MIHHDCASSTATITLLGELDIATRHLVSEHVRLALALRPRQIRLDLSQVTFLDSTGLGSIIAARTVAGRSGVHLGISAMSFQVRRLLELTGTADSLCDALVSHGRTSATTATATSRSLRFEV